MSNHVVSVVVTTPLGIQWVSEPVTGVTLTVNWLVVVCGLLLMGLCIGRMNSLNPKHHKLGVRLHYLLTFVGAFTATGSPWFFPHYPQVGSLVLLAAVLASTLMSSGDWRDGPPDTAHKEFRSTQQELFHATLTRSVVRYVDALRSRARHCRDLVTHLFRRNR